MLWEYEVFSIVMISSPNERDMVSVVLSNLYEIVTVTSSEIRQPWMFQVLSPDIFIDDSYVVFLVHQENIWCSNEWNELFAIGLFFFFFNREIFTFTNNRF